MKSGSLRRMPAPPMISTDCGHVEVDRNFCPSPCGLAFGDRRKRHSCAGRLPNTAIDQRAGSRGIDVTDDGDLEVVAGEDLAYEGPEILGRNGWDRFQGAAWRTRVGVAREGGCPTSAGWRVRSGWWWLVANPDKVCSRMRSTSSASKRGAPSAQA